MSLVNLEMLACISSSIGFLSHYDHYQFNDIILSFGNGFKQMVLAKENGGIFEAWVAISEFR